MYLKGGGAQLAHGSGPVTANKQNLGVDRCCPWMLSRKRQFSLSIFSWEALQDNYGSSLAN